MNLNEFAERTGFSRATVWRAISGNGRISSETRELILKKAEELNLKPSRSAQALRSGQTRLVELWIPHLDSQFSGLIVDCVQSHLSANGYDLIVRGVGNSQELNRSLFRNSLWPVDGILAFDPLADTLAFREKNVKSGTPFLSMGCYYAESYDHVGLDDYGGAADATRHLIQDAGCKSLVFVIDEMPVRVGSGRYNAVVEVAGAAGVPLDILIVDSPVSAEGLRIMNEYLAEHRHPDGIFCINDSTAIGVQLALTRHRIRVPDDTALVGFDGIEATEFMQIPLTTVRLPISQMCAVALEFLQRRISDPSIPVQRSILKPELIVRESSMRRVARR